MTFILTNKIKIERIDFDGNANIKGKDLRKVIQSALDGEYAESIAKADEKHIKELYQKYGYFEASVTARAFVDEERKEAILAFDIYEGPQAHVRKISFPDDLILKNKVLRKRMKTKEEKTYQFHVLNRDIKELKKIYREKDYLTVKIDEPKVQYIEAEDMVDISIPITEGPKIIVYFVGRHNISKSALKDILTLYKTNNYSNLTLRKSAEDIGTLYKAKGYYDATVTYDPPPPKKQGQVFITFNIDEGKPLSIAKITFKNNTEFSDKELRKHLMTKARSPFAFLPWTGWIFSRGIFDEEVTFKTIDLRVLNLLYKQRGYQKVKIKYDPPEIRNDKIYITIHIYEGPQTIVESVELDGNTAIEAKIIKDLETHLKGKPYNSESLVAGKSFLRSKYNELGYVYAKIEPRLEDSSPDSRDGADSRISLTSDSDKIGAQVTFYVSEGPRARLGKLHFTGNEKTRDIVLKREIMLNEGDILNMTKLDQSSQLLLALGIFDSVRFELREVNEQVRSEFGIKKTNPKSEFRIPKSEGVILDLNVNVRERFAGSINVKGGYSPSEQIRGTFEVAHNNLFGRANRLSVILREGARAKSYEATFLEPWLFRTRTRGTLRLFHGNIEEQKDAMATGGTLGIARSIRQSNNISFQYEYRKLSQELDLGTERTSVSSVGLSFQRDTRRGIRDDYNPLDPKEGWFNKFSVEYAGLYLGGENDFYKLTTDNRHYFRKSNIVWVFALRAGYAKGLRSTKKIITTERFRTGGSTTIRGYRDWEIGWKIGPSDGGDIMLVFNTEARFPIHKIFEAVFFFDTGNVWDKLSDIPDSFVRSAIGFGIRLNTPIGPARFDYGFPLNMGEDSGIPGEFFLALGHAF
ncbi:MAG: BamA/TamA family outer membrane protein [Deltaproteobacteria bacterium]|nr:BamA/TamA family outer membrane protein [Deltaproteobacteria bacterium]